MKQLLFLLLPLVIQAQSLNILSAGGGAVAIPQDSIAAAFGANLATGTMPAPDQQNPMTLLGTSVAVTDSAGVTRFAPLYYVSTGQVNFVVPAATALGTATVTITSGSGVKSTGAVPIVAVQPGLYVLNGASLIAANVFRVSGAQQSYEDVYTVDGSGNAVARPIDLSNGQVYLLLYGNGIRNADPKSVTVSIGGLPAQVLYSGPQGTYAAFDQVNVQVPESLAGKGIVTLQLTAAGKLANPVTIAFK